MPLEHADALPCVGFEMPGSAWKYVAALAFSLLCTKATMLCQCA